MRITRTLAITATALLFSVASVSAQTSAPAASTDMQRHSMEGTVTKVDAKKGWIDVKTSEGSMKLHYPPSVLQNVKKGDRVTVELGLKDNGPAASPRTTK